MARAQEPPVRNSRLYQWIMEHRPAAATLPGLAIIDPCYQGDCDGLCGLYSIINAIQLVLAPHKPLKQSDVRALFVDGIHYIAEHGDLSAALTSVVEKDLWHGLAESLCASAQPMANISINLECPFAHEKSAGADFIQEIERMITSGTVPAVLMRGKYRSHYSVLSAYTPLSLRLFDSYGYRWVRRASCRNLTVASRSTHSFDLEGVITFSLA